MKLVNALAIPFFKLSGFASYNEKMVAKNLADVLTKSKASDEVPSRQAEETDDGYVTSSNRPWDEACELDFDASCF